MSVPGTARAELLSEIIGEGLDRLATIDLHGRGIVKPIYDAARERQGGKAREGKGRKARGRFVCHHTGCLRRGSDRG